MAYVERILIPDIDSFVAVNLEYCPCDFKLLKPSHKLEGKLEFSHGENLFFPSAYIACMRVNNFKSQNQLFHRSSDVSVFTNSIYISLISWLIPKSVDSIAYPVQRLLYYLHPLFILTLLVLFYFILQSWAIYPILFARFLVFWKLQTPLQPHDAFRLILPLVWIAPSTRKTRLFCPGKTWFWFTLIILTLQTQTSLLALSSSAKEFWLFSNLCQMAPFFLFTPPHC